MNIAEFDNEIKKVIKRALAEGIAEIGWRTVLVAGVRLGGIVEQHLRGGDHGGIGAPERDLLEHAQGDALGLIRGGLLRGEDGLGAGDGGRDLLLVAQPGGIPLGEPP